MSDNFDQRLAEAAFRLEQEAAVHSPAGVRARGDQRRRRHTATMAVAPVVVLAIAGTVGLMLQPSGGSSRQGSGPPSASSVRTSATTSPGTTAAAASTATVDLAQHTLAVFDAHGQLVKTLKMTAGKPESPTPTGTFTVVDKKSSKMIHSMPVGETTYDMTVASYIDLGPNAPAIYAGSWRESGLGKENLTHGDIELGGYDAAWLYNRLTVGDTIRIVAGPAS